MTRLARAAAPLPGDAGPVAGYIAGYIAGWRPSSVSPRAADFARDVIAVVAPGGRERAKSLLWAAGKLADYALGLGLEPVPEVLLHPSVAERFTRCAPGLSGAARRTLRTNLRFIGRRDEVMAGRTAPLSAVPASGSRPVPRRWLALAVLCISLLIVTLDNTVLNVVLPTLARDLHATNSQLQWIVDAYVMVFAGLLLVAGSAADRLGRKRTLLAGLVVFAAGSAWAAFSGSVGMLIAARASMGIGGALIMPSTLSIITNMFTDPAERQRAIGFWAGTSGVGIALGPILGGLLLAHFWWGSVFLINVPIAAIGAACALLLVPNSRNPAAAAPDVVGAVLSIAGLGLVLWSLIEAPVRGWSSGLVIGAGLGGLAVLASSQLGSEPAPTRC
ncbi:MAG: MFS transporter [Streptosporangiaceae bacterium]